MSNLNDVIFLQAGAGGGAMSQFILIGLILVVFYFFMIRPQQKKQKEEKNFREGIKAGQEVVTIGGIHGKVLDVKESTLIMEIDKGTRVEVEKSSISLSYSTQGKEDSKDSKDKKK